MKATRLVLAALALMVVSACSSTNITGPEAVDQQATPIGSGIGNSSPIGSGIG